jgi:hypothetical protein
MGNECTVNWTRSPVTQKLYFTLKGSIQRYLTGVEIGSNNPHWYGTVVLDIYFIILFCLHLVHIYHISVSFVSFVRKLLLLVLKFTLWFIGEARRMKKNPIFFYAAVKTPCFAIGVGCNSA